MAYKLTMYGVTDYDRSGFGKMIRGTIVLRENIPKITTARILACRYSKQYMGTHFGTDISVWDGNKVIEKICWHNDGCRMEKEEILDIPSTPKGYSPVIHYYYTVNARDGTVKFKKKWQQKF